MDFQTITVACLVGISCIYAAQALMPAAWRVRFLRTLAQGPLPERLKHWLQAEAQKASACGCDGCDRAVDRATGVAATAAPREAKIIFMRRPGA